MKKILFLLFFLIASVALFAHTWEIRVKQNQNGTLTWYGQSYHGAGQCGFANSGISINGVNYNWTAEFSGSTLGLNASLFTVSPTYANCNCGRTSYGTVTTPYIGGNLSVTAYSTNACYSLYPDMPAGNGAFIPPPPPVCTSCPLTGWGNTVAASGNNNGTFCNPNDDYTTATINVNHLSCASITGDKQFRVIFDPSGSNVAYGPFNYSTGIQTNITINIPYGTSNSTPVKVIDDDFPCELTHGLSLPGGQYLGEKETVPPTIICPANITVGNNIGTCVATIAINNPTATDNCGTPSVSGIRSDALALTADYPKGITTIIWTATDASGNKKTCNQTVTVNDTQAPNAVTQNLTVFLNASGNASLTSEQVNNGSTDNCSTPSLSITPSSFDCSHVAGVSSAGNALQFNGGYMDVPNEASLNPLNEWTLETWVNTTGSGFQQGLIEKYDCDNNYGYLLRITSSNKIMAGVTSGCSFGGAFVTGNTTIVANTWYHISATFNRTGNVKLYINGVLEGTTPVGVISSSPSNGSLKIGARGNDANTRLAGFMDEVKVWSIERTQAQIQADMNKSLAGSETGLQAYYRFEEPIASNTVHDITPLTTTNTGNLIGTFSRIASTADIGHSNPVILTATDVNGNSATRTAFITVIDDILPTITCPAPIAVNNDPSQCGAVVSIISATATDNCGAPTVTGVRSDALALTAAYPVGVTTINWTATDNSGLKATCSQMIRVVDNTPPSIICPTSVTVQCASEVPDVSIGKVRTSDNCDGIVTVNWEGDEISNHTCENSFNIARTFKAIDAANNIATCTQTITVHDNTAPVIICPENIQVNNASNQCGADVTFSATATDNCSGTVSITYSTVSGSFFNVGTTSVTVTATDICGNSSNCSFDVTITDNELPVITCPTPLSIHTDLGVCGAKATFDVTATDNCSASVAFTSGLQSGSIFPVGSTTNVFTATDASGNTATCSFTVKVTDNELPVITCPTPLSINTSLGVCGAKATFDVTAIDNCSATVAFTSGLQSGSVFPVGSTTNVFTATDASGNTAKCSFTVTVKDNELPVITCPTPLSINTDLGVCGAKATFDVTATDNCSATVAFTSGLQSGSVFPVGSTTNVFTATDASGNTAKCSFTVTVKDNELPVITCPTPLSIHTDLGVCGAKATFVVTATDNCSATVAFTSGLQSGSVFPVGSTTNVFTATDASGNTAKCSFTVKVTDNELPVITCPTPLSINTDLGVCGAKATFVVTATDNCSATVAFTSGLQSGSVFPVGSTTNVFTATDASGNTAKCSFTVKVTDNELPVITCPTPLSINTNLGVCGAKATFDVTATDNCSATVAFTSGLQSGSVFPVGSTRNVFTATDASGNTATCSFTIKVIDNELPVITCPLSTSRNTNAGLCTYTVVGTEFNALATDNCRVAALTFTLSGATTGTGNSLTDVKLYKGTTTVTWTAVDAAGNVSTCSSTINVNDDQNPTGYIIYATKEVKFGEYNYINGNIGVTAADGKASFKKYDVLNPYFVKAKNIEFDLPSSVANRIYSPATDGPNPQFFAYNGSTLGLSNYNVSSNTVLAGNYKDLTIKKGVVATLQGNNFGKISIEEGAQVTFSSAVINVEEIDIQGGKKSVNTTNVYFTNPSSVKVKGKVKIDADCRVNVNGPKVTFYVGDNTGDEEKFTVKGDNSQVTANVMIPNGKLKVNGGESRMSIMTGWYIVEKLESTGKYITWNTYDCSMPTPTHRPEKEKVTSEITAHVEPERNVITFVTNQGTNTGFWTVEKRNDGTGSFDKLVIRNNAQLKNALQYHTFYDKDASEGENFYRIKLTYLNGDVAYSAIKGVTNKKLNDFIVYPNPAIDEAWIDLKSFEGRQVTLVLSDMAGKPVQQQVIQTATSAPYLIDIAHLPTGLYLIKIQAQGRRVLMRKIQVTK